MSNKEVQIPFCKTVHATREDFADFQAFVNRIETDPEIQKAGVVKVVPPSDWKANSQDYEELMKGLYVKNPIEQNFCCKKPGVYELYLIQRKSMKVTDYRKRVEHSDSLSDNKEPEKVEKMYWKSLAFNPPLYGADVRGSLFEEDCDQWNLNKLRGILEKGLGGTEVSGINVPYFYFGAWRTTFAWHCEDFDLPSINYLHYGKPKFWYAVSTEDGPKLEEIAKRNFPEKFHQCSEFMRHKNTVIDPYLVKSVDPSIKIHKVMQQKGEFVITMPGAYHTGFNWGFNIAEAVNFATNNWLSIFPRCHRCKCSTDNVRLSPKVFYSNLVQSRHA